MDVSDLSDAEQRRRFRDEIDRDFSVTAPAGVGKTYALTERILTLAEQQPQRLSGLYVITYTKKAAIALRERVYERLRQQSGDRHCALLRQSFFGTIHSLCWQLVQKFESESYELLRDDTDLRNVFLASLDLGNPDFAPFDHLFRFMDVDDLLGRVMDIDLPETEEALANVTGKPALGMAPVVASSEVGYTVKGLLSAKNTLPEQCSRAVAGGGYSETDQGINKESIRTNKAPCSLDVSLIFDYQPKRKDLRAIANIEAIKRSLRKWLSMYRSTQQPLELPQWEGGGKEFQEILLETFRPFYQRLSSEAAVCGRLLKEHYASFRREHGCLTYADCIERAQQCLETDEAKAFYRKNAVSILLDEAQDTDRAQFRFLQTLVSSHPNSHFSMVGDPQQSIYGARADIRDYLDIHRRLVRSRRCEALVFSETFRCPPAVVSELNARFPKIFNDPKQVAYVPLRSALRGDGCVRKIAIPYFEGKGKTEKEEAAALEARVISDFLATYLEQNPRNLSDICLLLPRNEWLLELKQPLEAFGWKLQLHSDRTTGRDNALFCNCLATIHCINFPGDTFEEAGLLSAAFGCSDEALAYLFARDRKQRMSSGTRAKSGFFSEQQGGCTLSTDCLFERGVSQKAKPALAFKNASGMFATDGDCRVPLNSPESFEDVFPSSEHGASKYFRKTNDDFSDISLIRNGLERHLNSQTVIGDVKAAEDVRHQWRQMLQNVSEQSLCTGAVRLTEFFRSLVPSTPTDAYFADMLLETAFQTQLLGQSWLALERRLRAYLNEEAETEVEVRPDALQGLSCHKAKGLEWKTVILPFFYRPVRYKQTHYPYVHHGHFLWHKTDWEEAEIASDRRCELERLLYVTCTRTKQHLFFVQDASLWKAEASHPSFGSLYGSEVG